MITNVTVTLKFTIPVSTKTNPDLMTIKEWRDTLANNIANFFHPECNLSHKEILKALKDYSF